MKTITLLVITFVVLSGCQKEYCVVCTEQNTGERELTCGTEKEINKFIYNLKVDGNKHSEIWDCTKQSGN